MINKVDQTKNIPLQLSYINNTDSVKRVCAFEIFNKNEDGIEIKTKDDNTLEYIKKYYYNNPHCTDLIRIQSGNLFNNSYKIKGNENNFYYYSQAENPIYLVSNSPTSYGEKKPAIIPFDNLSPHQFQLNVLDSKYSFVMDGLTHDLEFDLMPNESITFSIFFTASITGREVNNMKELFDISENINKENKLSSRKYLTSIVIENKDDVPKDIILFDKKKYEDIYSKDTSIDISDIFKVGYENICNIISNKKDIFNSIRVFTYRYKKGIEDKFEFNGINTTKQLLSPIEFNSGNKYYPAINITGNEFNLLLNDINIIGEELSSENTMKVTVMPKTRVIYLFKNYENRDNYLGMTSESYMNIEAENISDSEQKVDVFSIVSDKNKEVKHNIFKNKMNLSYYDFKPDYMRIFFYNEKQLEEPIFISSSDDNGNNLSAVIHPIDYLNINKFHSNFIDIAIPLNVNKASVLFNFKSKSDGVNIVLFDSKNNLKYVPTNRFPIWVENTTDNDIVFELPNSMDDFKELPEGLNVFVAEDSTLFMLLNELANRDDVSLCLDKIYTENPSQITQIIKIKENLPIITHSYFSANQFNSKLLIIGDGFQILDFTKIANENSVKVLKEKQKVSTNIHPKTKVAYMCSVRENKINLDDKIREVLTGEPLIEKSDKMTEVLMAEGTSKPMPSIKS